MNIKLSVKINFTNQVTNFTVAHLSNDKNSKNLQI